MFEYLKNDKQVLLYLLIISKNVQVDRISKALFIHNGNISKEPIITGGTHAQLIDLVIGKRCPISRQLFQEHLAAMFVTSLMHSFRHTLVEPLCFDVISAIMSHQRIEIANLCLLYNFSLL